jgi:hypothetical protein
MTRKFAQLIFMIMLFSTIGCVKETYDMNKLSTKVHLSPTLAISAVKGSVLISDLVKSNDTIVSDKDKLVKIVFDQNNLIKIVFKKDSIIDLKLLDFYDLSNMVFFSQSYTLGDLTLDPFLLSMKYAVGQIVALNDGSPHPIPPFGSIDLGEQTFSFDNFDNAVFESGSLDITIKNNLPATLNPINVKFYNGSGHTILDAGFSIPSIPSGGTSSHTINLSGKSILNPIYAGIVLTGSPGNPTPVMITTNNSNIQLTISGSSLVVKSGRVKLPQQTVLSLDGKDTLAFDGGNGVELDELKTTTANLSYHIESTSSLTAALAVSLPTAIRGGSPVSKVITVPPGSKFDGSILFDNTVVDLGSILSNPYNRVPFTYSINVNSGSNLVTFNNTDKVKFDIKLLNPVFDYVKGYFGQITETIAPDSLNLQIEDVLKNLKGDFLITNPSIKLNYSNSFAIPMEVDMDAAGKRKSKQTVNLGLNPNPFSIASCTFAHRDIDDTFIIDKSNSKLPELISMLPEIISFSGSATMNPEGNSGLRDNYIFSNSRFLGSLEVEVPLEFKMANLQFKDTLDNFLKDTSSTSNNSFKPEDFELLRLDIIVKNGFPLGISLNMSLYDSINDVVKSTVSATSLLSPAQIDANGKVTTVTETKTSIEFTKEFFGSINKADKIILEFTLNTTDSGTKDVKFYSDYKIDYTIAVVAKPDINLK